MGKKNREPKRPADEVIVIDLNDDDNSSDELEVDHLKKSTKSKKDKKSAREPNPRKNLKGDKAKNYDDDDKDDDSDCIDLTEQDVEQQENDESSEEIVLIEDDEGETAKSRKRKLPAYAEFRKGVGFTAENLRAEASVEVGQRKAAKQKKRRSFEDEKGNWRDDKGGRGKQISPKRQDWGIGARDRPERSRRSPDRYTEKDRTSEYRKDLRHSPRKHSWNINYRESPSPGGRGQEENGNERHSPRKRKNSRSVEREVRKERSRDSWNDRSRSPLSTCKRMERDDRKDYFGARNGSETKGSHMQFEKGQRRWEKVPVNGGADSNRNININGASADKDSTDGPEATSKSLSAAAVSVKSGALLVLPHPSCFILKGKARVQPLVGAVCIMGHILSDCSKTYDVYSPECSSLVTMETITGGRDKDAIMEAISSHVSDSDEIENLQNKIVKFDGLVVLKVSRLDSALCDYVTTLTAYQNLFIMGGNKGEVNRVLSSLGVSVFQNTWQPHVTVSSELKQAIDDWTESLNKPSKVPPCMMVVGGKDSGKSTTNRLLINHSLNSTGGVYFLECDVGQTEFTPPGCVSLQYITQPILGPPFTHQRKPLCCYFFGGVTPQDDPSIYIDCVQHCIQTYQQHGEPGPLIVNTMGWVKGLGLQLLIDTLRMLNPSHVIQLWCRQKHQNCDRIDDRFHLQTSWRDLTKENCWEEPDKSSDQLQSTRREHKLMVIDSISKSNSVDLSGMTVRLRPVDFRNLSLLSHLYSNLDPHMTLTSTAPYVIPWRCVAIHVCYMPVPRDQILYSLNASVVALCHSDLEQAERPTEDSPMFFNSMPLCDWIGFGIVRGVDPVKKELYIVTSVDLPSLKNVNTLLKGSVTLPEQLLMKQHCHGDRLYVDDEVKSLGLATVKPRKHMPRKRLQVDN